MNARKVPLGPFPPGKRRKPAHERKWRWLQIRVRDLDHALFMDGARLAGKNLSEWIRDTCKKEILRVNRELKVQSHSQEEQLTTTIES